MGIGRQRPKHVIAITTAYRSGRRRYRADDLDRSAGRRLDRAGTDLSQLGVEHIVDFVLQRSSGDEVRTPQDPGIRAEHIELAEQVGDRRTFSGVAAKADRQGIGESGEFRRGRVGDRSLDDGRRAEAGGLFVELAA